MLSILYHVICGLHFFAPTAGGRCSQTSLPQCFLLLLPANMAEVRRRFGTGACDFAHKICKRYRLETPNKQGRSAIQASSLSAGLLLGDFQNGELRGAERAADRVTVGGSQDGYTRVTPLSAAVNDQCFYYLEPHKECSLLDKAQAQKVEVSLPQPRSYDKFRRTSCTFGRQPSRSFWLHGQFVFIRAYTGTGTRSEPLYKTKTGYYEILEVSPTATQAQIKTAYYKQSFVYHPDRNAGSEDATVRFSDISEAYTVLGNKGLRKKYDRGLLSLSDLTTARPSAKEAAGGPAKPPAGGRRSVMGADSRGGVFDFDQFFKEHYREQLQREKDYRVRKEEMLRKEQETTGERKLGRMMETGVGLMLVVAVAILLSLDSST